MDGRRLARARCGAGVDRRLGRLRETGQVAGDDDQGGRRDRHRRAQRQGLQRSCSEGPARKRRRSSASAGASSSRRRPRTTSRTSPRLPAVATTSSSANGFLMGDSVGCRREALPGHEVRDHRLPLGCPEGQAEERPRHSSSRRHEAGYLVGVAAATVAKGGAVSSVGGQAVPAVVAFLAGYKAGAKQDEAGIKVLIGVLQELRRPGQVQGARAEPDRAGSRRSSSRRPAAAASARSRLRRRRASGASASTPTRAYLGTAHPDERDQEGRPRRVHDRERGLQRAPSRAAPTASSPSRTVASASARSARRRRIGRR